MSSHENHDTHNHTIGNFEPLSDNNANISPAKFIVFILGLATLIFLLVFTITRTKGYLRNEEQAEWKLKNNKPFKDSHDNWYFKNNKTQHAKPAEHAAPNVEDHKADDHKADEHKTDEHKH